MLFIFIVVVSEKRTTMWLHYFVGGSTGPGCSLLRFDLQEKIKLAKVMHLSSWISAAI